jgi:hypothetical protein
MIDKKLYSRTSLKAQHDAAQAVGWPEAEGVCDAYYPYPNQAHGHEGQNATDEVECAAVQVGEGTRQKMQNPSDEDIK